MFSSVFIRVFRRFVAKFGSSLICWEILGLAKVFWLRERKRKLNSCDNKGVGKVSGEWSVNVTSKVSMQSAKIYHRSTFEDRIRMAFQRNSRSSKAFLANQELRLKQQRQQIADSICQDFPDLMHFIKEKFCMFITD